MQNIDLMDKFKAVEMENSLTDMLELLLTKDDIELKTEIVNPPAMSSLQTLARVCEEIGFIKTAETINFYIDRNFENMVSYKRKGRAEFVDAIKGIADQMNPNLSLGEGLTQNLKDK